MKKKRVEVILEMISLVKELSVTLKQLEYQLKRLRDIEDY